MALSRSTSPPGAILHHIPDNVTFEQASLTEPICVAYNALVEKTPIVRPGDTVVIQGPGPIGMMALFVAKLRGASEIVMLGTRHDSKRLSVAAEIGATQTLNIDEADPLDLVRSLGDGYGADLVVDCSGVSIALQSALEMVRPNGTITKIGWGPQPMDFNLDPLVQKGGDAARLLQPSLRYLGAGAELAVDRADRPGAHHRRRLPAGGLGSGL